MYNHGLTTFVLGQAHGMTGDPQIGKTLDLALKLIYNTQCEDGGWDYRARRQRNGHDLSLAVMQAKAIRSAADSGLAVPPGVVPLAIQSVREHYKANNGARNVNDPRIKQGEGQFTYDGNRGTTAMAAAGVVCMQEFGQYQDWRIPKNMDVITKEIRRLKQPNKRDGRLPFDAYTLYYVDRPCTKSATARTSTRNTGGSPTRLCGIILPAANTMPPANRKTMGFGPTPATSTANPGGCTALPSPVLFWPFPTDTCPSCKKAKSKG